MQQGEPREVNTGSRRLSESTTRREVPTADDETRRTARLGGVTDGVRINPGPGQR